jgi:glycosyltransferase involved in cell wall biosynthesis
LPNAELLAALPRYRALLLPSLNETFGMVYVEALFAGLPILFTRGTGIDGYLDGLDVGHAVPPRDVDAIAAATLDLWRRSDTLRANIASAAPQLFATFDPATNLARYRADVRAAVGGGYE